MPGPTWQCPAGSRRPGTAVGIDQIDRDGRADIDDDRRAAGRTQAIGGQGIQQPIDADHVGPWQLDDQRQIARSQQHEFIVRAMIAEPVDQPRRRRAVDAANVPTKKTYIAASSSAFRRNAADHGYMVPGRDYKRGEPGIELIELRQAAGEMQRGLRFGQAGGNGVPKQPELDPRVANVNGDEGSHDFVSAVTGSLPLRRCTDTGSY